MTAVMVTVPEKSGSQQPAVRLVEPVHSKREVYRGGVAEASSLDQLSQALDRLGSIRNAEGTEYPAQYIKDTIADIKDGKENITAITRAGGLRTKVAELVIHDSTTFDELYRVLGALGEIRVEDDDVLVLATELGEGLTECLPAGLGLCGRHLSSLHEARSARRRPVHIGLWSARRRATSRARSP